MLRFVDSFSKYFDGNNSRSVNRRPISRNLNYQNLEARHLLAGIAFDAASGVLLIEGSPDNDVAVVSFATDVTAPGIPVNDITVSLTGFADQSFTATSVSELRFEGFDGDDQFTNSTAIPSNVFGGGGNDIIFSGFGSDTVSGGSGNDQITGGAGDDFLAGNSGEDSLFGGAGEDEILGGSGVDQLRGDNGDDRLVGQGGDDMIFGNAGEDTILGGAGDDTINGGLGADDVRGGNGLDSIVGGGGNDSLFGGADSDRIEGNDGEDRIFGGEGDDFIFGGADNDVLVGENGDDEIDGADGDDEVFGLDGNDIISGGDGIDRLFGAEGNDTIEGGLGNDLVQGNQGIDIIRGGLGDDLIFGGEGSDQIFGDTGEDIIIGNAGDDLINAGFGDDIVFGDFGNDEIIGGAGEDRLFGQGGDDDISGGTEDDIIQGGDGNDIARGGFGDDILFGNDGDDSLYGQVGEDFLLGQAGNDGSFGGVSGGDTLIDREGRNRFIDFGSDEIAGLTSTDARLVFRNGTDKTTRILQATQSSQPLAFVKDATVSEPGAIAVSELVSTPVQTLVPGSGNIFEITTVQERTLTFADWDELDQSLNDFYISQTPGLIALDWAGPDAVAGVIASQSSYWTTFLQLSGWTQDRPDAIEFFDVSGDLDWFFLQSAPFADPISASTQNPTADFASIWNLAFETDAAAEQAQLVNKLNQVDLLFSLLEFF